MFWETFREGGIVNRKGYEEWRASCFSNNWRSESFFQNYTNFPDNIQLKQEHAVRIYNAR